MKKLFSKIGIFAKRSPSLFIVIIIGIVFTFLFATYESLHLTSTPQFCSLCHKDHPSGPGGEFYSWEKNIHAAVNVTCIDCHGDPGILGYGKAKLGGIKDLYGEIVYSQEHKMEILTEASTSLEYASKLVPSKRCEFCHTVSVNEEIRSNTFMSFLGLKMRNIDKVVNPNFIEKYGMIDIYTQPVKVGVDPNHLKHMNVVGLSCLNCHMGVAHSGEFYKKPKMETCFSCHDTERENKNLEKINSDTKIEKKNLKMTMPDNDNCVSCHVTVAEIQRGSFLESKGIEAVEWVMPSIDCLSCHEDAFDKPKPQSCISCHDDSYGDIYTSWQDEFNEQKKQLTIVWQRLFKARESMPKDMRNKFNELNYFYKLVDLDGSKGIHNIDLMNEIFNKSFNIAKELEEKMKN